MENRENRNIPDGGLKNSTGNNRAPYDNVNLPYEDPAIINPEELATFPKPAPKVDAADIENESENRLVNKRSPVRDGTHITRTGNGPDENGYI